MSLAVEEPAFVVHEVEGCTRGLGGKRSTVLERVAGCVAGWVVSLVNSADSLRVDALGRIDMLG